MTAHSACPAALQGRRPAASLRQKGVALVIVIVLVMMSALLALWGFQSSSMNEAVVGNDADYARAFEAAQALLQDAELDISGKRPDGSDCVVDPKYGDICRNTTRLHFIDEQKLMGWLLDELKSKTPMCSQGICLKRTGAQDFWNDAETLTAMTGADVAARFGQYTGAATGANSNPILANRDTGKGGWYWVEVMLYEDDGVGGGVIATDLTPKLALALKPSLVYRITAIARGLKPHTQVVLQSTYAQQTKAD